ncbi:hypothetical protein I633_04460 [Alteromonas mediterranea 615]|uniref:Pentapeptide repeat-containing protein n=1 Tax=Alteromonas mediterranea 615 TaxID=1300253 RepID=S5AD31_9ALTE|nr:hypothetical protein I633_04460 [Alteromonas mediterranea 615]
MKWGIKDKSVLDLISILGLPFAALMTGLYFTSASYFQQSEKDTMEAKQQEEAQSSARLQSYFANITSLTMRGLGDSQLIYECALTNEGLRLSKLARAYTNVLFSTASKKEKRQVIAFLYSGGFLYRKVCNNIQEQITWVDLRGLDLSEVDLSRMVLTHVNLHYTNLSSSSFVNSAVGWGNFEGANLSNANFGLSKSYYDENYSAALSLGMLSNIFTIDSSTLGNSKTILPIQMEYPDNWLTESERKHRDQCPEDHYYRPYLAKKLQCVHGDFLSNPNMIEEDGAWLPFGHQLGL